MISLGLAKASPFDTMTGGGLGPTNMGGEPFQSHQDVWGLVRRWLKISLESAIFRRFGAEASLKEKCNYCLFYFVLFAHHIVGPRQPLRA